MFRELPGEGMARHKGHIALYGVFFFSIADLLLSEYPCTRRHVGGGHYYSDNTHPYIPKAEKLAGLMDRFCVLLAQFCVNPS